MSRTLLLLILSVNIIHGDNHKKAQRLARQFDEFMKPIEHEYRISQWNYETKMNETNRREMLLTRAARAVVKKEFWIKIKAILNDSNSFTKEMQKYYKINSFIDSDILPIAQLVKYLHAISNMTTNYIKEKIRRKSNDQNDIIAGSNIRDDKILKVYWLNWHNTVGRLNKKYYRIYLKHFEEISRFHGYKKTEDMWKEIFEYDKTKTYDKWKSILPLYKELHAYVRRQLKLRYPNVLKPNGPIPAHLLGTLKGDSWDELYSFTIPYPGNDTVPQWNRTCNITYILNDLDYTKERMFREVQVFFNTFADYFKKSPQSFWYNSVFDPVTRNKDFICHPKAWDFLLHDDVRVKLCGDIDEKTLGLAFKLGGQIQYFTEYSDKIFTFRDEDQLGLSEAFGGFVRLTMSSPQYLRSAGILKSSEESHDDHINRLYRLALEILPSIPYNLILDNVRHDATLSNNPIEFRMINCYFWNLREQWQGIHPANTRMPPEFDFGTDYNVLLGEMNMRYYKASIVQFQIYKHLCDKIKKDRTAPAMLSTCNVAGDPEVGYLISRLLGFGASKEFPLVFQQMTGDTQINTEPLLEYFKPLHEWLQGENKKTKEFIGWEPSKKPFCIPYDQFSSAEENEKLT